MAEDDYRRIFSANLKYYMEQNNKTQMDLMKDLGLSSSTVSNWCTGLKLPRMDKVQMLADYFNIYKSDLIEEDGPVKAQKRKLDEAVLAHFHKLNDDGKTEGIKRIEELTYIPRYAATSGKVIPVNPMLADAARSIAGASDEDKAFDEDIMNDDLKWGD